MNPSFSSRAWVTVAGLALFLAACSSPISSRIQEKADDFAHYPPEVQKNIREGTIEPGYTADMVYMALGKPSKVQVKDTAHGKIGIWTFANFYPESYDTSPDAPAKPASTSDQGPAMVTPTVIHRGGTTAKGDNDHVTRAPASGALATDEKGEGPVPASSSFTNVGSSDYGHTKYEKPVVNYNATDRRDFKMIAPSFSGRSAAMEPLDIPDMESASLYVVFVDGRVAQMKLGRR